MLSPLQVWSDLCDSVTLHFHLHLLTSFGTDLDRTVATIRAVHCQKAVLDGGRPHWLHHANCGLLWAGLSTLSLRRCLSKILQP